MPKYTLSGYKKKHKPSQYYKRRLIKTFRNTIVKYLMDKQNHKCEYCSCDVTYRYQIDHILPVTLGGTDGIGNLCLACPTCNRAKWDMPLDAFNAWIEQLRS